MTINTNVHQWQDYEEAKERFESDEKYKIVQVMKN
jgi:hypothetical protein